MKTRIFKTTLLAACVLTFAVACGKSKNSGTGVNAGRDVRVATPGPSNLPTNQGSLAGTQGAMVTQPNQAQMDEAAKILVSATIAPESVGTIRSIELKGQVRVDRNTGAINASGSRIWLTITDSFVGTDVDGQQVQPIQISVAGSQGLAANYQANLTFADQYGTITIQGTFNMNTFQGTVSFNNTQGAGFNGKRSGTLGQFQIPTCAFFVCQ